MDKPKLNIKEDCLLVCNSDGNTNYNLYTYGKRWVDYKDITKGVLSNDIKCINGICEIITSPTWNCQISSIAGVNLVLGYDNPLDLLTLLYVKSMKKLLLIDVHQTFEKQFEDLLGKKNIVIKSEYVSTNASKMVIYLFKTTVLEKYYKTKYELDNTYWNVKHLNWIQLKEEQSPKLVKPVNAVMADIKF